MRRTPFLGTKNPPAPSAQTGSVSPSIVVPTGLMRPVPPKHSSREEYALMPTESKRDLFGFEERHLTAAGTRLPYLVGGQGPPLVLLHGLGGLASNGRLVAPGLMAERRVVIPELPGHGGSGRL